MFEEQYIVDDDEPWCRPLSGLNTVLSHSRVSGNEPATHYSLNGGKYFIKPERMTAFLQCYGAALYHREKHLLYLVERPSKHFKFHMDLDIKQRNLVQPSEVEEVYLPTIFRVLQNFYGDAPPETFLCLTLSAPGKRITESRLKETDAEEMEKERCVKSGFHLHFPNLVVDAERALTLRDNMVVELKKKMNRTWPENAIDDVVDESIYLTNGIRMIGSDKRKACPNLDENKKCRTQCPKCHGRGKINEDRPYALKGVINANLTPNEAVKAMVKGAVENEMHHYQELSRMCSIRTTEPLTPYYRPPNDAIILSQQRRRQLRKQDVHHSTEGPNEIGRNAYLFKWTEREIRTKFNDAYHQVQLAKMKFQCGTSERIWTCTLNPSKGSSYCMQKNNGIGGTHRHAAVYFILSETRGMWQKCQHPTCRSQMPTPRTIPIDFMLHKALFTTRTEMLRMQQISFSTEQKEQAIQLIEQRLAETSEQEQQLDQADVAAGTCNPKWKAPNLVYRQKVSEHNPTSIKKRRGNEDVDECDKLSFRELFQRDKQIQQEKQTIYPLLHEGAVPAQRAVEQLWRQPATTPNGRPSQAAKRKRWE